MLEAARRTARPRRRAAGRARGAARVLRGGRGRRAADCPSGSASSTSSAPGHLHHPGRREARQPPERAGAARRRAVVGRDRAVPAVDVPGAPSSTRRGSCSCSTSSTTSSRARGSTGSTRTPPATTPRCSTTADDVIDAARRRAIAGAGRHAGDRRAGRRVQPARHDRTELRRGRRRRRRPRRRSRRAATPSLDLGRTPPTPAPHRSGRVGPGRIENEHLRVECDDDGLLTSVFDKEHDREVLAPGARGNRLPAPPRPPELLRRLGRRPLHVRRPSSELDRPRRRSTVVEPGPLRGAVRFSRSFGASTHRPRRCSLAAGSRRLDFATEVDWHERTGSSRSRSRSHVHTPPRHLRDPVRPPRAADAREHVAGTQARFEVCAQRGPTCPSPATASPCSTTASTATTCAATCCASRCCGRRRGPTPSADRGHHRFTYALLPHAGDSLRRRRASRRRRELNPPSARSRPTDAHAGARPAGARRSSRVDRSGFDVVAVKRADRSDGIDRAPRRGLRAAARPLRLELQAACAPRCAPTCSSATSNPRSSTTTARSSSRSSPSSW